MSSSGYSLSKINPKLLRRICMYLVRPFRAH